MFTRALAVAAVLLLVGVAVAQPGNLAVVRATKVLRDAGASLGCDNSNPANPWPIDR